MIGERREQRTKGLRNKRFLRIKGKQSLKIKRFSDYLLVEAEVVTICEATETDYLVCTEVNPLSVR